MTTSRSSASVSKSRARTRAALWLAASGLCLCCTCCRSPGPHANLTELARSEFSRPRAGRALAANVPGGSAQAWTLAPAAMSPNLAMSANLAVPASMAVSPALTSSSHPVQRAAHWEAAAAEPLRAATPLPRPPSTGPAPGLPPWSPPGIAGLWPRDEYVCDGGDQDPAARATADGIQGINPEDTVVRYETEQGEARVTPSNCVCLYAPRFAAVRKVSGVRLHEQHERMAGVEKPTAPAAQAERLFATTVVQPVEPGRNQGIKAPLGFRETLAGTGLDNLQSAARIDDEFLPYENFRIVRRGSFDSSEKPRLSQHIQAALAWTHEKGVQVLIDEVVAFEATLDVASQLTYSYELPPGKPQMRLCKVASRKDAQPGDVVEFTLRFDNVGNESLQRVTLVDNLTSRLEYVEGTQECSLPARFFAEGNEGESLTLQWQLEQPLPVGEGGVIRFHCRVR